MIPSQSHATLERRKLDRAQGELSRALRLINQQTQCIMSEGFNCDNSRRMKDLEEEESRLIDALKSVHERRRELINRTDLNKSEVKE